MVLKIKYKNKTTTAPNYPKINVDLVFRFLSIFMLALTRQSTRIGMCHRMAVFGINGVFVIAPVLVTSLEVITLIIRGSSSSTDPTAGKQDILASVRWIDIPCWPWPTVVFFRSLQHPAGILGWVIDRVDLFGRKKNEFCCVDIVSSRLWELSCHVRRHYLYTLYTTTTTCSKLI